MYPFHHHEHRVRQLLEIWHRTLRFMTSDVERDGDTVGSPEAGEVLIPLILEDGTADGNTKGLSERAKEDESACRDSDVFVGLACLRCELERGEKDTGAYPDEHIVSDAGTDACLGV